MNSQENKNLLLLVGGIASESESSISSTGFDIEVYNTGSVLVYAVEIDFSVIQ